MLNTVEEGLEDIRQGKVLIVVDDEDRENEGDFIVSGEKITPEIVNFMITHGRGLLCAPLPRSRCEELGLAPMAEKHFIARYTVYYVGRFKRVWLYYGSFCFRPFVNIKALVAGNLNPSEFARPGHVFPLYGAENGVLERNGHTEATLDMTRMAGLKPGGALVEILNEDGTMARLPQLGEIAAKFGLKIVSIKDIQEYRKKHNL